MEQTSLYTSAQVFTVVQVLCLIWPVQLHTWLLSASHPFAHTVTCAGLPNALAYLCTSSSGNVSQCLLGLRLFVKRLLLGEVWISHHSRLYLAASVWLF